MMNGEIVSSSPNCSPRCTPETNVILFYSFNKKIQCLPSIWLRYQDKIFHFEWFVRELREGVLFQTGVPMGVQQHRHVSFNIQQIPCQCLGVDWAYLNTQYGKYVLIAFLLRRIYLNI